MIRGKCPRCGKIKFLTKHSKTGHHEPPYVRICRKCHDEVDGLNEPKKYGKKYQPGTPKWKKKT